jgi:ABC-type glycerol-3-phosphate transport system substrate-binding protein
MIQSKTRTAARLGVVAAMIAGTVMTGAVAASASSHHGEIKGEVSNNKGHDIGIKTIVRLFEKNSNGTFSQVAQVFTDKHGDFKFKHLASGNYYLEALGNAAASPLSDAGTYRSEFYQNSRTIENSSKIRVHHNDTTELKEIELTRN